MLNRKNDMKNVQSEGGNAGLGKDEPPIELRDLAAGETLESVDPADIGSAATVGADLKASDLQFDPESSDLQPGTIEDREGYEAAIESGKLAEIPERNIKFVGDGEPPLAMHGSFSCTLPDAETQKRGFYHKDARRIISHFPKKYKKFQKLGDV